MNILKFKWQTGTLTINGILNALPVYCLRFEYLKWKKKMIDQKKNGKSPAHSEIKRRRLRRTDQLYWANIWIALAKKVGPTKRYTWSLMFTVIFSVARIVGCNKLSRKYLLNLNVPQAFIKMVSILILIQSKR